MNERYYYKAKNGKGFLNLKSPLGEDELVNYDEITKEEFERLTAVARPQPTEEQLERARKNARIRELKKLLAETDYQAIKFAEGWISAEDYAPMKAQRQEYRDEINELEG